MMQFFLNKIRNFRRDTSGTAVVEFMIMFPFLVTVLFALVVYFDAYRTKILNLRAAFTISDIMSREVPIVDAGYVDGLQRVFEFMIGNPQPSWIRVTLVQFDTQDPDNPNDGVYILDWSKGTNGKESHTAASVAAIAGDIPIMAHGATALIVETHMTYIPPFEVSISPFDINNRIVTRPRWGRGPCWETCI